MNIKILDTNTSPPIFLSAIHLISQNLREEIFNALEPNPTTYYPYPDTWQEKPVCGVIT